MRQKNKSEGTKIAQAAKELNVTSVTIRRYISEFNIETTADENGIKVLPAQAMAELFEIRRLKESGLTNPKVLEMLEEQRSKGPGEKSKEPAKKSPRRSTGSLSSRVSKKAEPEEEVEIDVEAQSTEKEETDAAQEEVSSASPPEGKSKYSLTCQTCNKVFEHMNPRLRDCLDCYRLKRKERRRGGDKHKSVIQHPLAQHVLNKTSVSGAQNAAGTLTETPRISVREQLSFFAPVGTTPSIYQKTQVRNYRKAVEETRQITSNLKRRLERPDLPEAERRFLEQIYAYQLILHQGWKHLAEYKSGGTSSEEVKVET